MVTAIMIVEMMGKPKEYLQEELGKHIDQIDKVKGVKVVRKVINEPKEHEKQEGIFTTFAEIEFECEDFEILTNIVMDFLPTSIEVLDPSRISLPIDEVNLFLNNVSGRLHVYDNVAKVMKNREFRFYQEIKAAKKLLQDNGIVDKEGKILKGSLSDKENSSDE